MRRHSACKWLARAQQAALDELAAARTAVQFHRRIPHVLERCREQVAELDTAPTEDFSTSVTVRQEIEDYSQQTHTRIALEKLRKAGVPVHVGQSVGYVVLRGAEAAAEQRVVPTILARGEAPGWRGPAPRPSPLHAPFGAQHGDPALPFRPHRVIPRGCPGGNEERV